MFEEWEETIAPHQSIWRSTWRFVPRNRRLVGPHTRQLFPFIAGKTPQSRWAEPSKVMSAMKDFLLEEMQLMAISEVANLSGNIMSSVAFSSFVEMICILFGKFDSVFDLHNHNSITRQNQLERHHMVWQHNNLNEFNTSDKAGFPSEKRFINAWNLL